MFTRTGPRRNRLTAVPAGAYGVGVSLDSPLGGILVADFSRVLAGPLATMTLADLGATVVKVERPGGGDETRAWGPPWTALLAPCHGSVTAHRLVRPAP
jgi:hypothetical protein